jgi:hypothetical protein
LVPRLAGACHGVYSAPTTNFRYAATQSRAMLRWANPIGSRPARTSPRSIRSSWSLRLAPHPSAGWRGSGHKFALIRRRSAKFERNKVVFLLRPHRPASVATQAPSCRRFNADVKSRGGARAHTGQAYRLADIRLRRRRIDSTGRV